MVEIRDTGQAAVVVTQNRSTVAVSQQVASVVRTSSPGVQGPVGQNGASGAGLLAPINFAYGDASPANVLTLGVDSEITEVSLQIEEAFDGTGAALSFGTAADPDAFFGPTEVLPGIEATFEFSPRLEYAAGTVLVLTITPGSGASQGRGQIIVSAVPTS